MTRVANSPQTRPRPSGNGRKPSTGEAIGVKALRAMEPDEVADLGERLGGAPVPGVRMSEREFVDWAFDNVNAEWADGEVYLMAPANDAHESVDEWLGRLLGEFIERGQLGHFRRNMFVRLPKQKRRRVPDLSFISTSRAERIRPTYIDGAPDLAVEIVSPDSQNRDRRDKFLEYQAAGVREYWVIDPMSQTFDAYAL